jgi:phosphatidylinositol glycan class B
MKTIFQSPYSKLLLVGLILHFITAWFSDGYHHPDEHFQILEFCNYKLGLSPASDLPWEFRAQIRPALQPCVACIFISIFKFTGIQNPFILVFFLRLIITLLGWLVICKLALLLLPDFSTEKGKILFIGMILFLWFVPYLNVRFSSENAAGISFLWVLYFLLKPLASTIQKRTTSFLLIGMLLGLSFFFRFQMAFAVIGLGFWLLFIKRISLISWMLLIFSCLLAMFLCVFIDRWFYGNWVFTPYNYYVANVVQHVASNWGVEPWWYYFGLFFIMAVPPLGFAMLFFFSTGLYAKPTSIFLFVFIPFLIGHLLIGHKEMRFLYPMWFAFVYLVAIGLDYFLCRFSVNKFFKYSFACLLVLNFTMLLYRTFTPAQEAIPCYKFAHDYFKDKNTSLLCIHEPLYNLAELNTNFYKPANMNEVVFANENALDTFLLKTNQEDSVIVFTKTASLNHLLSNYYTSKRIYCLLPEWILKFNFNNWEERANIWSIYTLYKKK